MMGMTFIPFRKDLDSKGRLVDRAEVAPVAFGGSESAAAAMSTS